MPDNAAARERVAALVELRRWDEAAAAAAQAIALAPADPQPRCLLAQCQLGLDRPADALDTAGGALSVQPNSEWAHRLRSIALRRLGRSDEARDAALSAVALLPVHPSPHIALAEAELARGDLDAAREVAATVQRLAPNGVEGHDLLGRVALRRHDLRTAEDEFRAALAIEPNNPAVLNNLGVVLQAMGLKRQAVHYFGNASALDPRDSLPRRNAVSATTKAGVSGTGLLVWILVRLLPYPIDAWVGAGLVVAVALIWIVAAVRTGRFRRRRDPRASRAMMAALSAEANPVSVRRLRFRRYVAGPFGVTAFAALSLVCVGAAAEGEAPLGIVFAAVFAAVFAFLGALLFWRLYLDPARRQATYRR